MTASADHNDALFRYLLRLGDTSHILCHRLGEWCGHGPIMEEDIALTNVALDLIGQARLFYQYAGEVEGKGRTEDDLAFLRPERDFNNLLLVEQPNGDYAKTMARQFLFDAWNLLLFRALERSTDARIAEIAAKAVKEITYHRRHSSGWVIRMGDGTEESRTRIVAAFEQLMGFTAEFFHMDDVDRQMAEAGIGPDLESLRDPGWRMWRRCWRRPRWTGRRRPGRCWADVTRDAIQSIWAICWRRCSPCSASSPA